jgi:transcriptional regulator with XRE-family HTH domain
MIGDLLSIHVVGSNMAARDTNTFAWRLRQSRDQMGITQYDMCDKINEIVRRREPGFALSYPAYNKYETGDTATPRLPVLAAIGKVLGLSIDYLVTGHEPDGKADFSTEEAEQVAAIVDSLPAELRATILGGAQLLQRMHYNAEQSQAEHVMFIQRIKPLLPEQERIQAQSILDKINFRRG